MDDLDKRIKMFEQEINTGGPLPHEKKGNGINIFLKVIAVCAIIFPMYILMGQLLPSEKDGVLAPRSYYIVNKIPFVIRTSVKRVTIIKDMGWYYQVREVDIVIIPQDYVGMVSTEDGHMITIPPGKYRLDLTKVKVTLFKTGRQRYDFKTLPPGKYKLNPRLYKM